MRYSLIYSLIKEVVGIYLRLLILDLVRPIAFYHIPLIYSLLYYLVNKEVGELSRAY